MGGWVGGDRERGDERGKGGKGQVSGERAVGDVSMMVGKDDDKWAFERNGASG